MRIATATAYDAAIDTLQRRQSELADAQVRLTSGKRVLKASDDPTDAARGERALAALARLEATQRGVQASRNAMELAEGGLGDAVSDLQRARELLVTAGNGSLSDAERRSIATELQGLRDALFATANRSDGQGGHVFAGQGSDGPPFVDGPGGVQFAGVPGAAQVATGEGLPIAVDGDLAWMRTAPSGRTVFGTLDAAIANLSTTGQPPATTSAANLTHLGELDAAMERLQTVRSQVGGVLGRLDTIEGRVADARLANETERSNATDLDLTAAISDFQNRQTGYDAALRSYALVQRMSLFQYLGG